MLEKKKKTIIQDRIMIKSDIKLLSLVRSWVLNTIRKGNLAQEQENKLVLAVDEAISNIIEHAYEFQKDGYIDIMMEASPRKIQIVVINSGKRFNTESIKTVNILEHVKQRKKKGMGIFLMKQVMDEVKYTFKNGQNQLTLIKYL